MVSELHRPRRVTRAAVAIAAAGFTVAALATADRASADFSAATPLTAPAAALIVGGTGSPTLSASQMEELWRPWTANLTMADAPARGLVNVEYPATIAPLTGIDGVPLGRSVAAGADALLAAINETWVVGGKVVVWGISQGAMVLAATQRALAEDPSAPPRSSLTFVRVADPAANVSGMLNYLPQLFLSKVLDCTAALCSNTMESQYDTVVVVNQYDAFADFPDDVRNFLAVANALVGLVYRHGQTALVDLTSVPEQNISTAVNSRGATTTTFLVPSPFLPLTQPLRDLGVATAVVDRIDSQLRPVIDAGYTYRRGPLTAPAAGVRKPHNGVVGKEAPSPLPARNRVAEAAAESATSAGSSGRREPRPAGRQTSDRSARSPARAR